MFVYDHRFKMSSPPIPLKSPKYYPPLRFNPHSATDEELRKYLYPPRPNESSPGKLGHWNRIAKNNPEYVLTNLVERPASGLDETRNWSGAYVLALPPGDDETDLQFKEVDGTWVIPRIYPVENLQNGLYRLWTWVGLDGWINKVAFKIGVTSTIDVVRGEILKTSNEAAVLIQGPTDSSVRYVGFQNFEVKPGQKISAHVRATPGLSSGAGFICNETTNQWAAASIAESNLNFYVEGLSAEWILAGRNPQPPPSPTYLFPRFDPTKFENLFAYRENGREMQGRNAGLIDAEDVASVVTRVNPDGFEVQYGHHSF